MFGGTAVGAFRAGLRRKWAKTWARPDPDFIGSVKPAIGLMLGQRGARAGRDKIGHGAPRPRLERFGACSGHVAFRRFGLQHGRRAAPSRLGFALEIRSAGLNPNVEGSHETTAPYIRRRGSAAAPIDACGRQDLVGAAAARLPDVETGAPFRRGGAVRGRSQGAARPRGASAAPPGPNSSQSRGPRTGRAAIRGGHGLASAQAGTFGPDAEARA